MSDPRTGFSSSGQLDWVALSRAPISYSTGVISRLANADVELVTVQTVTAIGSLFKFPPVGQNLLTESLSKISSVYAWGRVLSFGIGTKHIVRSLSDSEEGATCVAILAALTTAYSTNASACIMRELSLLYGPPFQPRPSLAQWTNLVQICAGSLGMSNFEHYYQTFSRLIVPPPSSSSPGSKLAASEAAVAEGLKTLSDLSNGRITYAMFAGYLDSAWLAAVAQCLFGLCIEIVDNITSTCIYRTNGKPKYALAQAIFLSRCSVPGAHTSAINLISKKVYVMPNATGFLQQNSDPSIHTTSAWNSVFRDAYPELVATFPSSFPVDLFGRLLQVVSFHSKLHFSFPKRPPTEQEIPWLVWHSYGHIYHPRRTGNELLVFARQILSPTITLSNTLSIENCTLDRQAMPDEAKKILGEVSKSCKCTECASPRVLVNQERCYRRLAIALIRVIILLSPVTIDPTLPPIPDALQEIYLYGEDFPEVGHPEILPRLALLLHLFSGRKPSASPRLRTSSILRDNCSAVCHNGVCIYYSILRNISLQPLHASAVEVIRGSIIFQENLYDFVQDWAPSKSRAELDPRIMSHRELAEHSKYIGDMNVELLVEEAADSRGLSAGYYFEARDLSRAFRLGGISRIQKSLVRSFIANEYLFADIEDAQALVFSTVAPPNPYRPSRFATATSLRYRPQWSWCVITWTLTSPSAAAGGETVFSVELSLATNTPLLFMISQLSDSRKLFALVYMRACLQTAVGVAFRRWREQAHVIPTQGEACWVENPSARLKFRVKQADPSGKREEEYSNGALSGATRS
ncbi:hypothetical protein K469DRAFT_719493 [Zopfia rhizophila CBS 207.26]|uniref:Uncharacterized protein n=1 Tax=Zopfia rhizophila CBS 207.26 TaxID=1314779 RepID=A0A6A6DFK5_9PEZI|nr:hypothetical protein K469DRAFT_719493 [Zopfia rhizophila CBS 207.26]